MRADRRVACFASLNAATWIQKAPLEELPAGFFAFVPLGSAGAPAFESALDVPALALGPVGVPVLSCLGAGGKSASLFFFSAFAISPVEAERGELASAEATDGASRSLVALDRLGAGIHQPSH